MDVKGLPDAKLGHSTNTRVAKLELRLTEIDQSIPLVMKIWKYRNPCHLTRNFSHSLKASDSRKTLKNCGRRKGKKYPLSITCTMKVSRCGCVKTMSQSVESCVCLLIIQHGKCGCLPPRMCWNTSCNHKKIFLSTLAIKINFHLLTPSAQGSQGILTDDNLFKLLI